MIQIVGCGGYKNVILYGDQFANNAIRFVTERERQFVGPSP